MSVHTDLGGTDRRVGPDATLSTGPGFVATFAAEWSKFWSARSPRRNLILGAVLGIALSALLALAAGATFDDWSDGDRASFDPLLYSMSGAMIAAIFFIAVGAKVTTAEYSTRLIDLTFSLTPRRRRVIGAKAIVVALATWAAGGVAVIGMLAASQAVFGAFDTESIGLFETETLRTMFLVILTVPVFPVLAVLLGFLFRSTAPTITVALALLFGPWVFGGLFPLWWRENVLSLLPGPAADAVSIGHLESSPMYLDVLPAALVLVAWVLGSVVVTSAVVDRRDT